MSSIERYKKFFIKDYLMGPNSFRLLDELIRRSPEDVRYDRTLDLGCGYALTSLFLANETNAKHVYTLDLRPAATIPHGRNGSGQGVNSACATKSIWIRDCMAFRIFF